MKSPFELVPLLVAGVVGAGALLILISFFDNTNTKMTTYLFLGFLTGMGVQVGVRVTGVS